MKGQHWFDLFCALVTISAVSLLLIGYGESRAAHHCAALIEAALQ